MTEVSDLQNNKESQNISLFEEKMNLMYDIFKNIEQINTGNSVASYFSFFESSDFTNDTDKKIFLIYRKLRLTILKNESTIQQITFSKMLKNYQQQLKNFQKIQKSDNESSILYHLLESGILNPISKLDKPYKVYYQIFLDKKMQNQYKESDWEFNLKFFSSIRNTKSFQSFLTNKKDQLKISTEKKYSNEKIEYSIRKVSSQWNVDLDGSFY